MTTETKSRVAVEYYNRRLAHYIAEGLSEVDAAERADYDLLRWSNPPAVDLNGTDDEWWS